TLGTQAPGINGQAQSFSLPANVPDDITASAKARVSTNETNASINVNDECNATYRIVGTVDITVPNSAVTWFVGQSKTINWTSNGTVTPVLIQYSTNGTSGPWNNINGSYNAASGANNYTWIVEDLKNQSTCYVKVTHNISGLTDINDTSDVGFTIFPQINVTEPINNSNIVVDNTNTPIRWDYSGSKISSVDIFYRQNVSSSWQNIAYNVSIGQNDTYVWPSVPILRTTEAEVRVYDNDTYAVNGTSDEFNIIGKLNLTSPDASETNWIILTNTSQAEWTSAAVQTVKVYYSVNGSDGPWVYSKSVNGSAGVTSFDVPENVTNNASIKITDSSNENITYDISENNFSFVEDFQITQPEDNIALVCGQNYDIRWTRKSASALPNIKLEFFDGSDWSLIGGNITNSGEYLDWGVPNTTISTQCKVRVVSPISQSNNNESSPPFTIRGDIAVTNPNTGNESWNIDGTYPINWSYTGPITNVTIQHNYNGTNPSDWMTVVTRVPIGAGGNGSWNWTINGSIPLSTTARIRVYDSDQNLTNDTNDFNFTIKGALDLTAPLEAGIVMNVGETYNITWNKYGAITNVNLSYSNESDAGPWKPIVSELASTPTYYNWPIPDDIGGTLKVKVQDADNINVWNISANNFSIVGKIAIQRPDQAEPDWVVGEPRYINWTPTGTFSSVVIQGSTNGFADENETWNITTVPAGANATAQSFNYSPVEDKISNNVKIRISDALPARFDLVNDTSTDPFKIKGKLTVAGPDSGGEVWVAGTKPTTTWIRAGSIQNISVKLHDGSNWHDIANVLYGTDEYNGSAYSNWTVPDTAVKATKQAKINITDVAESSVSDESNNSFLIRGALAVTNPSSYGERIFADSEYNITWIKTGIYSPSDNVKLQYQIGNGSWQSVWSDALNASGDSVDAGNASFPWTVPGSTLSNDVQLRIARLADEINVPTSYSQPFAIVGNITVTSPQSGNKWAVSTTNPVKWTTKGNIENVSVYWNNGNNTWNFISYANGSIGNTTGYLWTIPTDQPAVMSPNASIKVSNTFDEETNDTSEIFSVIPRFVVTSPVADELLYANKVKYITWEKFGDVLYANLYWSKTNFTEGLGTLIEANVSNNGNYSWPVPDDLNNTVRVRVTYPDDEAATNLSAPFSRIVPKYEVVSPYSSAYDIWPVGTVRQVKWNSSSVNASTVNIYYSVDGTNYNYTVKEGADNSGAANATREYNWSVNDTITNAFKVMIQDAAASRSDISVTSPFNSKIVGYFKITYPDGGGGQNFTVNDNITIAWDKNGSVANAKLEIAKNDDWVNATIINASTPNTGVYPGYLMHDMISDSVKIRVSDINDPEANDTSDDYFKIQGAIDLTAPSAGDRLPIGYNSTIIWNATGNITNVDIVAYSSLGMNDSRFPYTLSEPFNISLNNTNNGNNETTYNWNVNDTATDNLMIRVLDSNDDTIYDETTGNLSIIGSFNIDSPNGGETWVVNETRDITWFPTGSSIAEAKIMYSSDNGSSWTAINESYNISNDGIINNTGNVTNNWPWVVPDTISNNTIIRIEDRFDETVNDSSNATFKIQGNFSMISPLSGYRWVTYENQTVSWNTTGSIANVNLYYSRDNFTNNETMVLNRANQPGVNNFLWSIPDPVSVFTINDTDLPVSVKVRVEDANDTTVYRDSEEFTLDYYNITWSVRDFLSNLQVVDGLLSVNDNSGWIGSGIVSPKWHLTPYGNWQATWTHKDYGDATEVYIADDDKNITVWLESKIVHVWEAKTQYSYDVDNDTVTFQSYLSRDGVMAGARSENGTFYTIADKCSVEMYYPNGTEVAAFNTSNVTDSGFFKIDWNNTSLDTSIIYNAITQIDTLVGGKFRTPFAVDLIPTVQMHTVVSLIEERVDMPISVMNQSIMSELTQQTVIIEQKMNETVSMIQNETANMSIALNQTLDDFETR
ncbi:MAG: hypothetical protein KAQ99_06490, partial [Candidatus Aureabacteria bacterium]|nr:hypothetical protein [Candidatus Auribacterota bacterium]